MRHPSSTEHITPRFRHALDQNALTLWVAGVAILASLATLPAIV